MMTQQLLELLKTWPEFKGRLEWLEQYPPDTPIMDALTRECLAAWAALSERKADVTIELAKRAAHVTTTA